LDGKLVNATGNGLGGRTVIVIGDSTQRVDTDQNGHFHTKIPINDKKPLTLFYAGKPFESSRTIEVTPPCTSSSVSLAHIGNAFPFVVDKRRGSVSHLRLSLRLDRRILLHDHPLDLPIPREKLREQVPSWAKVTAELRTLSGLLIRSTDTIWMPSASPHLNIEQTSPTQIRGQLSGLGINLKGELVGVYLAKKHLTTVQAEADGRFVVQIPNDYLNRLQSNRVAVRARYVNLQAGVPLISSNTLFLRRSSNIALFGVVVFTTLCVAAWGMWRIRRRVANVDAGHAALAHRPVTSDLLPLESAVQGSHFRTRIIDRRTGSSIRDARVSIRTPSSATELLSDWQGEVDLPAQNSGEAIVYAEHYCEHHVAWKSTPPKTIALVHYRDHAIQCFINVARRAYPQAVSTCTPTQLQQRLSAMPSSQPFAQLFVSTFERLSFAKQPPSAPEIRAFEEMTQTVMTALDLPPGG